MSNIPKISIIVAISTDLAIGKNNKLLWDISEDMKHFREITSGHPVIMGENTYYSIGRPLPKRTNIVLSQKRDLEIPGVIVCHSIDEAIKIASEHDSMEIFFIGGGIIYKQALPLADKLYLTIVEGNFEADTFFPEYRNEFTKKIKEETNKNDTFKFSFVELERDK